jgi:hypothetical protein
MRAFAHEKIHLAHTERNAAHRALQLNDCQRKSKKKGLLDSCARLLQPLIRSAHTIRVTSRTVPFSSLASVRCGTNPLGPPFFTVSLQCGNSATIAFNNFSRPFGGLNVGFANNVAAHSERSAYNARAKQALFSYRFVCAQSIRAQRTSTQTVPRCATLDAESGQPVRSSEREPKKNENGTSSSCSGTMNGSTNEK